MRVFVNGELLRAKRIAKRWTLETLARKAGVSARTVQNVETSARSRATLVTAELLAQALGMETDALFVNDNNAEPSDAPREAAAAAGVVASPDAIPPPRAKRAPSRLDALAAREPPVPDSPAATNGALVPVTARRLQDLLTGFAMYEGDRYIVEGRVDAQRALTKTEARLLGTKVGIGGRFHIMRPVVGTEELGITVHTMRAADTRALLAKKNETVRLEVRVVVPSHDDDDGFVFFLSPTPSPWALVVEAILP